MARKFGKENKIDLNPLRYNLGLLGESGIGKTTVIYEMCEKLAGHDGYLFLDVGHEDGHSTINGIVSEPVEDFAKFTEVIDDIIENKDTDYKDLKVVVVDTYDELIPLAEKESIRLWNKKFLTEPDKKVDSVAAAWGGFKRGEDKASDLVIEKLFELNKVDVHFIIIGHVKRSEITDEITGETYTMLTSNISQRYFNQIKTKIQILGLAYVDRVIAKQKTGKKNIVTHQDETINKATSETRMISFRDDSYSIDSKSRFADIVDKIPLDSDELIKALKDAIEKEANKKIISKEDQEKQQEEIDKNASKKATAYSKSKSENKIDQDRNAELLFDIKAKYVNASDSTKSEIRKIMADYDVENFKSVEVPTACLEKIYKLING